MSRNYLKDHIPVKPAPKYDPPKYDPPKYDPPEYDQFCYGERLFFVKAPACMSKPSLPIAVDFKDYVRFPFIKLETSGRLLMKP